MVTRFAPSPTGYLHLGHVYSALLCKEVSLEGEFLLRFEDIDHTRVRAPYYEAIIDDLEWLGMTFKSTPWRQLDRMPMYDHALQELISLGVVYPCYCTRKELIKDGNLSAPQGASPTLYSGKCKRLDEGERAEKERLNIPFCWRLNFKKALDLTGDLFFTDAYKGRVQVTPNALGDVILARKDIKTSYHIAVVVDDAAQGITHVVRGEDLLESTHVHRVLQVLLGYPEPLYHHHALICDETGVRLAKRHDALSLRELRERGASLDDVLKMLSKSRGRCISGE